MQKVVVHYRNGAVVRGRLRFFEAGRPSVTGEDLSGRPLRIRFDDVKAVFFVHRYEGTPPETDALQPPSFPPGGRAVSVRFPDGETIEGVQYPVPPGRSGFYLTPSDRSGNNRAIFVPRDAARSVSPLGGGRSG